MLEFLIGLIMGLVLGIGYCIKRLRLIRQYYELEMYFSRQRETYN